MEELKELRKCCAYIRVSTDKQEELSPDAQKRLLSDYASKNNLYLDENLIFIENGISGRKAEKRPEFMKMISLAKEKSHPFDVILVWKFSRFARNQEESIVYKNLLKKQKIDVISISEPIIDGPFGDLIERIIEWMDEYYSIRLSGEVIRGMTEKALRGGYQAQPPYGYSQNKLTGIPEPNEQASVVKMIFEKYLSDGYGIRTISEYLNSNGIKTKNGNLFEHRTVKYILQNPFYIGKIRWNRQQHSDHSIKDESDWIISDGKHAPIISDELWNNVQDKLKASSRVYKRQNSPDKHWLSGLIKCSTCGSSLGLGRYKIKSGYSVVLHCYQNSHGRCTSTNSILVNNLIPMLIGSLSGLLESDAEISYKQITISDSVDELSILNKNLSVLRVKESRIKDAYINGIDSLEEYKLNKASIISQINDIESKISELSQPSEFSLEAYKEKIKNVIDIISDDTCSNDKKHSAICSVMQQATWDKSSKTLTLDLVDYQ